MPYSRVWFASEGGIAYFHWSLRDTICKKLSAAGIAVSEDDFDGERSIIISFDNDADEAEFIMKLCSNDISLDL